MKRPSIPSVVKGSVRVDVPKLNVWIGLICGVFAYLGMIIGDWVLLAIGIGGLIVMPIGVAAQWLAQARMERKIGHWPELVQVIPNEDGERVAFVRLRNGDMISLVLPEDYSPDDDGGEWFFRQVVPDLATDIFGEEVDE